LIDTGVESIKTGGKKETIREGHLCLPKPAAKAKKKGKKKEDSSHDPNPEAGVPQGKRETPETKKGKLHGE